VPLQYFGVNPHPDVLTTLGWPFTGVSPMPFGSLRLWATKTTWYDLNPAKGSYDWTPLDNWLNAAVQNGVTDILYTFGSVPAWASCDPEDQTCVIRVTPAGSCDPPTDLNPDGSGSDEIWQTFVQAIAQHAVGRIRYWEVWNEPDLQTSWNGTQAQMARMAKDAYNVIKSVDSNALVTTPATVNGGGKHDIAHWLPGYFAAGGDTRADIVSFHGYVDPAQGQAAEYVSTVVSTVFSGLPQALSSKPIWDTEASWGPNSHLSDPDLQAAFVARMYLLQWSEGVQRFYWFQYGDQGNGTLCISGGVGCALNQVGDAYVQVSKWIVGATMASTCAASGPVWSCGFTAPGGIQKLAVWDASQTCGGGSCTTSTYMPNSIYVSYADLAGVTTTISPGSPVQVGAKPILFLNQ